MDKSIIEKINSHSKEYKEDMVKFLRDLIALPSESTQEKEVAQRILEEMNKLGYDKAYIDEMGNVIGIMGTEGPVICFDGHIDTVGVGDLSTWTVDPYKGEYKDGWVYGRGASDQTAGPVAAVYGGYIAKKLGLIKNYRYMVIGSIMEEDDEGSNWLAMVNNNWIPRPEVVVITEPTRRGVYRGHRGRMLVTIEITGRSCHASAPERGLNACDWASEIVLEIKKLNEILPENSVLGKGSITPTNGTLKSPSQNAVCDKAELLFDRRINEKEPKELVIQQIEDLKAVKQARKAGLKVEVKVPIYKGKSYTGYEYEEETYYPAWLLNEDHPVIEAGAKAYEDLFDEDARVANWTFCTNASRIVPDDMLGIPAVGFGPGDEVYAHCPDEKMDSEDLVYACAFYAAYSQYYLKGKTK